MRTLIIDNYMPNSPQMETLYKIISGITVHTVEVKDYSSISIGEDFKYYNAIVLSGSQRKLAEVGNFDLYTNLVEVLKVCEKPILGICFGHQLISMAFYEDVIPLNEKIEGYYMVKKSGQDELFDGLDEKFLVYESHQEMVKNVPGDFIPLAESPNCTVEAIKHHEKMIYGVQFHPERYDDKHPAGQKILENFFKIAVYFL
jgi:GMP synthase-like glutamine amidotransferase